MIKKVLTKDGLVVYNPQKHITIEFNRKETEQILKEKVDFDKIDHHPRVVHMEISNTCDFGCKYCYNKELNKQGTLSTENWKKIIDEIASHNVFEITFGGGEPFQHPDIIELANYVKHKDMTIAVTTNGKYLKRFKPKELKVFDQINVSYHQNKPIFESSLKYLKECGIRKGINYVLSKPMLKDLSYLVDVAGKYSAELLFLVYKPINGDFENQLPPNYVLKLAKYVETEYKVDVSVDGMAFGNCRASKWFVDINCKGDVFPCSFIRKSMGNMLNEDFKTIWKNRVRVEKCPYKLEAIVTK